DAGRPYFAMELVKGDPIIEYCDKNNLSIHERLELFAQVCTAVQHAHTKGIIHRDIKPSNILVSLHDGTPAAKVIDFGIAKATNARLTEKTLFTEHRQLIGTPEYMSPEQAEGSLDIDTRTDVYSLGVLLYELLTGSTPLDSKSLRSVAYAEIQRMIRDVDPPTPSTRVSQNTATIASVAARRHTEPRRLGTIIRGELDWIVMKALEKDRTRRYETANGLALDIRRYLAGQAVEAAPPGAAYRLRKLIHRHKRAVTAVAAVAAVLVIGVAAFAWQWSVASVQRDRAVAAEGETAERAEQLKQVADFQAKMLSEIDPTQAGIELMANVQAKFMSALTASGVPDAERAQRSDSFRRDLARVNATDTARDLIDKTILKPAVRATDEQFRDQPLVGARLQATISELYRGLGLYKEALALQKQALATRQRELGADHPDTLSSVNDLGVLLEASGEGKEAEDFLARAVEGRTRVLGAGAPDTLVSMGNLGNRHRAAGRYAEAEPLLVAAFEGNRRALGDDSRTTLVSANTLGYLYAMQGKFDRAEPLWIDAYERGRKAFGEEDQDVLVWTNN
ncbi:MAG: serine/threonine protein kinase, partial [Phycisphaerae bacterium]|nr:serine/threonine protein kinase [Phycisphaerae bacterium]